jgi:phage-related minor tail protein
MSNVIRSLMVKIGVDLTGVQKGLKKASKEFSSLGKTFSDAGGTLTRTLTVPILGAVAGLGAIVVKSASAASALQKMSGVTGIGTERLQELAYVGAKLDVALDSITGTQRSLVKAMTAAQGGADSQASVFKRLGVSVTDSTGHLRDSNVVLGEAIDALGRMTNPAERDAMALKIFGRNALALNPLIKAGGAQIARLTEEARTNGAVMSGSSVAALDRFKTSLDAMKLSISTTTGEIAMALLPVVRKLLPLIQSSVVPAIQKFAEWLGNLVLAFQSLSPGMKRFVLVLAGISVGIGPALSSIGNLYTGVASLLKLFSKMTVATLGMSAALLFLVASIGFLALVISEELNPTTTTVDDAADVVGGIGVSSADASAGANQLANGLDNVKTAAKGILSLAGFDEINQLGGKGSGSPLVGDLTDTLTDLTKLQSSLDGITMPVLKPVDMASLLGLGGLMGFVKDWNKFWEGIGASIFEFFAKAGRGFENLKKTVSGVWNDIKAVFGLLVLVEFVILRNAWTTLCEGIQTKWNAISKALSTAWSGFTTNIKTIWDGVGAAIRNGLNTGIDAINSFLVALNKLKITLPSIMGGGTIGFNIPLIPKIIAPAVPSTRPDFAALASGGVVDSPLLAMVGEQGREAVMPLERNTGWIDELAGKLAAVMGNTQQPVAAGAGGVSVYIGNEKLDGYIVRANARQALRSNGR